MRTKYFTVSETADQLADRIGQKIDESFIKMLCARGDIESRCLPSPDARENDIYMINESQLGKIALRLKGEGAFVEVKKEKTMPEKTEGFDILEPGKKYLTTAEASDCLGISQGGVLNLIRRGSLSAKKRPSDGKGSCMYVYVIPEEDVEKRMRWMEDHKNDGRINKHKKLQDNIPPSDEDEAIDIPETPKRQLNMWPDLNERFQSLQRISDDIHMRLDDQIHRTHQLVEETRALNARIDISGAYKEGFKEGWKAAMEAMGGK